MIKIFYLLYMIFGDSFAKPFDFTIHKNYKSSYSGYSISKFIKDENPLQLDNYIN